MTLIWHKYNETHLPPLNTEVIAYSSKWVDADFNPKGQRVGFRSDDGFISAYWWDNQDDYIAISKVKTEGNKEFFANHVTKTEPEFWTEMPYFEDAKCGG